MRISFFLRQSPNIFLNLTYLPIDSRFTCFQRAPHPRFESEDVSPPFPPGISLVLTISLRFPPRRSQSHFQDPLDHLSQTAQAVLWKAGILIYFLTIWDFSPYKFTLSFLSEHHFHVKEVRTKVHTESFWLLFHLFTLYLLLLASRTKQNEAKQEAQDDSGLEHHGPEIRQKESN